MWWIGLVGCAQSVDHSQFSITTRPKKPFFPSMKAFRTVTPA